MFDVVIIGSGFGGAICALRLAQAGRTVLVLERGKRYRPGEFPRDVARVDELFWRYPRRTGSQGLYDVSFFSGLGTVVASGVGGGSLIYANIHIRPDAAVFEDPRWPRSINRKTLDPYYDRVAEMLSVSPVPKDIDLPKRNAFQKAAQSLGRPIFDPDQAVAWREPPGPNRKACELCAECEFGCQLGAKNTLDFTYLAQAEALGAELRPRSMVSHVEPAVDGYRVHYQDLIANKQTSVDARRVVLCAGTLGTNALLLRSRDITRTLPKISNRLGKGFSANGDFLGNIQHSAMDLQPWHGPDVTSVIRFDYSDAPFTLAAPAFSEPAMRVLAAQGQPRLRWLRFLSPLIWPWLNSLLPLVFSMGRFSKPTKRRTRNSGPADHMTNLFAIGRDNAGGRILLKGEGIDISWDYARENALLLDRMQTAMQETGRAYGGYFSPILTWELFEKIVTVHPLGGCAISERPENGVVDLNGEVHNYPGLFVADGSIVPAAIGFHPVMTISALAERIAESMAATR